MLGLDHPLLSGNEKCVFKPENIDGSYPRIMLNDSQFSRPAFSHEVFRGGQNKSFIFKALIFWEKVKVSLAFETSDLLN
jgi:hypothetical protein